MDCTITKCAMPLLLKIKTTVTQAVPPIEPSSSQNHDVGERDPSDADAVDAGAAPASAAPAGAAPAGAAPASASDAEPAAVAASAAATPPGKTGKRGDEGEWLVKCS